MDIRITGIKFRYLSSAPAAVASPITLPASPEWPPRRATAAVYALSRLKDADVNIGVCFQTQTEDLLGKWIDVRAVRCDGPDGFPVILQEKIMIWEDGYSAKNGIYGYLDFAVDPTALWEEKVGSNRTEWQWQYRLYVKDEDGPWTDLEKTQHEIFITLDKPGWPWGHTNSGSTEPPPWLQAVQYACKLAEGATEKAEAASMITKGLHASGLFKYNFDPNYTGSKPPTFITENRENNRTLPEDAKRMLFRASGFTDRIKGLIGLGNQANCTDFAYMLMVIGNSIGCGIQTAKLAGSGSSFELNPSLPIGWDEGSSIDRFSYHEIAWMGEEFNEEALIFDASLGFEGDDSGLGYSLNPVANMPYGDQGDTPGYHTRLAKEPSDVTLQPYEKTFLRIN